MMSNEDLGRHSAAKLRAESDLGVRPLLDLALVCHAVLGVDLAVIDVDNQPHGLTLTRGGLTVIGVPTSNRPMRQRSSIAHEIGHLRHDTVTRNSDETDWGARTPAEIAADAFARHFLAPLEGVRSAVGGQAADESVLSRVVQTFLVSPHAAAIQMRNLGLIDQATVDQWKTITARHLASRYGWKAPYDALVRASITPTPPQSLMAWAIKAYESGLIGVAAIAQLSGSTDVEEIRENLNDDGITPASYTNAPSVRSFSPRGDAVPDDEFEQLFASGDES